MKEVIKIREDSIRGADRYIAVKTKNGSGHYSTVYIQHREQSGEDILAYDLGKKQWFMRSKGSFYDLCGSENMMEQMDVNEAVDLLKAHGAFRFIPVSTGYSVNAKKIRLLPWAMDEGREHFIIFMVNRGKKHANAFVWVEPGEDNRIPPVRITTFREVIEYFTQLATPMYFGDDRPEQLLDAAVNALNQVTEMELNELIENYYMVACQREKDGRYLFEKECLDFFKNAKNQGHSFLAV